MKLQYSATQNKVLYSLYSSALLLIDVRHTHMLSESESVFSRDFRYRRCFLICLSILAGAATGTVEPRSISDPVRRIMNGVRCMND